MSNKSIFNRIASTPPSETVNATGGRAYDSSPRQRLAQISSTNCFNGTFYVGADENLKIAKDAALALKNDPEFLAKCAVYSRTKSYMKDMPAFLMAVLADSDTELFRKVFPLVINNGKMLRNFCQIARSGATGRIFNLSCSTIKKAISAFLQNSHPVALLNASVGNELPLRDIIRAVMPRPLSEEQATLFAYLRGATLNKENNRFQTFVYANGKDDKDGLALKHEHDYNSLPAAIIQYEEYKKNPVGDTPRVDFQLLSHTPMTTEQWRGIAMKAPWGMTRMNLNTFARHGVFKGPGSKEAIQTVADRLRNPEEIKKANVFPYQLMMAYKATIGNTEVPSEIREALQDAMEIATDNVPTINGVVKICVDTSGSMDNPVTGMRKGSTTKVSCLDCAAMFAASLLRKNKSATILPFADTLKANYVGTLNGRDSIATNATKLTQMGRGGTNCSAPLRWLNEQKIPADLIVYLSDYESWCDENAGRGTAMLTEWNKFRQKNPHAKLVCMDLTPRGNSQVKENPSILQVGGFSDQVFNVVAAFAEHGHEKNFWVAEIEKIALSPSVVKAEEESDEEEPD